MVNPDRLLRALRRSASGFGVEATVALIGDVPWASATYVGARHVVSVAAAAGPALDAWVAALAELDLAMPEQVSDVTVAGRTDDGDVATIRIEALTLEV